MYNFHASANVYTDFWNNTFGELCKEKPIKISCHQVWQAFVQESIRTIADVSGCTLVLKDGLSIDEVTREAFSKLGANGIILPASQHSCSECTQKYKRKADFLIGDDPAPLLVEMKTELYLLYLEKGQRMLHNMLQEQESLHLVCKRTQMMSL